MGSKIERAQGNGGPKPAGNDRMNLRNLLSWKKPAAEPSGAAPEPAAPEPGDEKAAAATSGNVVAFPLRGGTTARTIARTRHLTWADRSGLPGSRTSLQGSWRHGK
jgi:hypothetical protein